MIAFVAVRRRSMRRMTWHVEHRRTSTFVHEQRQLQPELQHDGPHRVSRPIRPMADDDGGVRVWMSLRPRGKPVEQEVGHLAVCLTGSQTCVPQ
jgi:hypothetical protein